MYLVMASLRPEYNQKIKTAVLLSPVATVPSFKEMTSPILRIVLVNADGIYVSIKNFFCQLSLRYTWFYEYNGGMKVAEYIIRKLSL